MATVFNKNISLTLKKPLLALPKNQYFRTLHNIPIDKEIILFHPGFGGSSGGNISFDDYIQLAKAASKKTVFKWFVPLVLMTIKPKNNPGFGG